MILYIAEKPSLGRAIAAALPLPHRRADGYIRTGDNQIVSWCIGHLLEQAEPEAYDPAFKQWRHEHLPIIPQDWKLKPKKETKTQLGILRKLIKDADTLVNAGDPDREGQLLVDEVIGYVGVKGKKLESIKRCLISDLNPAAVRRSLDNLRLNNEFNALSTSALARSRADWLYGINMTRAFTLQGRKVGYQGVLSVGRVQTPVLGLVVRRDADIEQFVSQPFFEVWANLTTADGETFKAKWSPSEACARFLDDRQRNLSKPLAENVAGRVSFKPASVKQVDRKKRVLSPPLPYNLSGLQIDASRAFGYSAQQVLDTCQSLYEKHTLITYPRSDSRYLPAAHFKDATDVIDVAKANLQKLKHAAFENAYPLLDTSRKSKAWNDARVDAHHAIIPTQRKIGDQAGRHSAGLSQPEQQIYAQVCRNYFAQFLPDHTFYETRADILIESGLFIARAKEADKEGWKVLFPVAKKPIQLSSKNSNDKSDASATDTFLPSLKKGQSLESLQAEIIERKTTPPAHFTDATLLAAMTGIATFVRDTDLKKILRETDGLGTEATRAGIIELLFRRQFLQRVGKTIRATPAGAGLINALPESATLPDMTARWESLLSAISQQDSAYEDLMSPLTTQLSELIKQCRDRLPESLRGVPSPPRSKKKSASRQRRRKNKAST